MKAAARMALLAPSAIRAIHEGAPPGAIRLGLGEPDWDLPEPGRRALAAFSERSGPCSYGPNAGLPELVSAIAALEATDRSRVMVGSGSQGALFALFQAWLGPGDEVLVPDPGFPAYTYLAHLAGAGPRPYQLGEGGNLEPEAFRSALEASPRAKLAIVNHPSNPTGGGASAEALREVAGDCAARGLVLVSDEVYRELHFGRPPASLLALGDRAIVLGSLSKGWGAPGLRVGWAVGDPELLAPARLVHANMVSCPARPSQEAAIALIEASARVLPAARAGLAERWEAMASALGEELGIKADRPAGAFYYWIALPRGEDSVEFCYRARDEAGVVIVPGTAFGPGGRGRARISFAARPETIREGIRRLATLWS